MLCETALFDTLHSELAIVLEETRDDEIDAEELATSMLEKYRARHVIDGTL